MADAVDALLPVAILVAVLARLLRQRLVAVRRSPLGARAATRTPLPPPRATVPVIASAERRVAPPTGPRAARPVARPARVEAAPAVPAPAPHARRRASRRLDLRRDLIAAELLAPPVALRASVTSPGGGVPWR